MPSLTPAAILLVVLPAIVHAQESRASRLPRADEAPLARILAMSDARTLDTALVDSTLRSGRSHLRASTARAIGQVGGLTRAPRLRELVSDSDTAVAAEAAFALGMLRDSASRDVLAAALRRVPAGIEAAWALGEIGGPAREQITRGLGTAGLAPRVTEALLLAASKLRPIPLTAVLPHLQGRSVIAQRAAAYAIARPGVAGGVRALIPLASSLDAETRMLVASALGQRAAGDSLADIVTPALRTLARDRDSRVRINASRSLASHGTAQRDAVLALLRDADANVRIATAQSLSTAADTGLAWWAQRWNVDTSMAFRRSILESAARRGLELPALAEWLARREWQTRAAALGAVQPLPSPDRKRLLAGRLLEDTNDVVRAAAYGIVLAGPTYPTRDSLITVALADRAMEVRLAGLGAMRVGRAPASVPGAALSAYQRARDDRENDVRVQAIALIRGAWRADSASFDAPLLSALRTLPRPVDPLERAAAIGTTPLAGWGPATGESRRLAWYDSVVRAIVRPAMAGRPSVAEIRTSRGAITLELLGADAPITVENFVRLARSGYYSGTRFHRVVPNFVIQDGDPTGTGSGGPGYAIRDELNRRRYQRGTLGMALSGPDTGGSQYFICHSAQPHLDGHYTIFGQLRAGALTLDRVVQGDRILAIRIR